jgi:hypothetical protein
MRKTRKANWRRWLKGHWKRGWALVFWMTMFWFSVSYCMIWGLANFVEPWLQVQMFSALGP